MNPHVRKILELLSDLYEEKELDYHLSDTEDCRIRMNESLAHTLLTNLIKNAIIHSPEHGRVDILIHSTRIEIVNDGNQALDERQMFKRFYKGHSGQKNRPDWDCLSPNPLPTCTISPSHTIMTDDIISC